MTLKIRPLPQTVQQGNFLQELDKMKRLDIIEITLRERLTVPIHLMKIGKDYIDLLTGSRYTVSSKQGVREFVTMKGEVMTDKVSTYIQRDALITIKQKGGLI